MTTLTQWYPWATDLFIANAPMRFTAGPELATAVSSAGGLGFIGPSNDAAGDLKKAAELIHGTNLSSSSHSTLPVGKGFLLWSDDLDDASAAIKTYKPCAVWLFAPQNPGDIDNWTRELRASSPETKIWLQIGTVAEAREIVRNSIQPDVVVVQGAEAGGHGRAVDGIGLMTLFPEVADVFHGSGIPLLAAGGIADARGAAAAYCLGASGIVMGTRFLASPQVRGLPRGYQQEVVNAGEGATSTTRTLLYNHLQGIYGWPKELSPRVVLNRTWDEHLSGVEFDELKRKYDEAKKTGDAGYGRDGRLATYAGAGIGLIRQVKDAGRIVEDIRRDVGGILSGSPFQGRL